MIRAVSCLLTVITSLALASGASAAPAGAPVSPDTLHKRTGFDDGHHAGWLAQRKVEGIMWVDTQGGARAPAIHHTQQFAQGSMMFQSRPSWLAPLKAGLPVRLQLDAKARVVNYLGSPTRRELVIELRDHHNPPAGYPYASVWTIVGYLDAVKLAGWRTWGVTIADTAATELPAGWGGYGAEDEFGNPRLPEGRTFADVLANADEIAITTFQPGYLYGSDHDFDLFYDNIEIGVVGQ